MRNMSIRMKITLFIVFFLLFTFLIVIFLSVSNNKKNLFAATYRTVNTNAQTIHTAIRSIMLSGEATIAVRTMKNIQKISDLKQIDLFRISGLRAFYDFETLDNVNRYQNIFKFQKTPRTLKKEIGNPLFQRAINEKRPIEFEDKDKQHLEYYYPLKNEPECQMCHGPENSIRGVLHLKLSIADVYRQLRQSVIMLSTILILACFTIAVCLIIFLRSLIIKPLADIGDIVSQVGQGNLDVQVDISRGDELGMISEQINAMVRDLKEQHRQIQTTQDVTIQALAGLAETRDNETGGHIRRTMNYVRHLAIQIKSKPKFSAVLTPENIELLYKSAPLHDVGKVGVPDRILLKPGKLTEEEFEEMKKHTTYGRDAIKLAERGLGTTSFLRFASEIAYTHHEKWDGSGYPQGLSGENIPVSGRLMALADVYDALISKRVYKAPFPHTKAVEIIKEGKGKHFDPDIVDAFLKIESKFQKTAVEFADSEEERQVVLLEK